MNEYKFDAIFAPKEPGTEEMQVENNIEKLFLKQKADIHFSAQSTLFHDQLFHEDTFFLVRPLN